MADKTKMGMKKRVKAIVPKPVKRQLKAVLPNSALKMLGAKEKEPAPIPNSYQGQNEFTVVSAVYNVEKYLDDYFRSLYSQTLVKEKIKVIMVDDGSTDSSAEIIKEWQLKWPNSITYLVKENGGQASARNLGMQYVETEWVTFINPDDFVSERYFEEVDKAIWARPALKLLICNIIFYREQLGELSDTHALKHRFKEIETFFAAGDENIYPIFSMSSSFLRMSHIRKEKLEVRDDIKPNFEDGHFINRYLLRLDSGLIGFFKKPCYYYRKRNDGSSSIDAMFNNFDHLTILLKNGYLDLLNECRNTLGYVPRNIQNTILYDLSWQLKRYVGHPEYGWNVERVGLSDKTLSSYKEIFSAVEPNELINFSGRLLPFVLKYGISNYFKNQEMPFSIAYVKRIDFVKKQILIESLGKKEIVFYINGAAVNPIEEKIVCRKLFDKDFCYLTESWIAYENEEDVLSYRTSAKKPVRLSVCGKQLHERAVIATVTNVYAAKWQNEYSPIGDTWLLMDRDTQADDNAEHLYRYIKQNHPEQNCVFALRRDALDWERLKSEGFNLVAFGEAEYENAICHCSKIISSHADAYVYSYYGDNFNMEKDYIFLQHGVTKDDISSWINPKPISIIVTATEREYNSITENGSPYVLTKKQTVLSGFPRHDALLRKNEAADKPKKILIAPTWRRYLTGNTLGKGNERDLNDSFAESDFRNAWQSFISSPELKRIADEKNCGIVFFPHANILPYIETGSFTLPDYIEIGYVNGMNSIQDYFVDSLVCITDYSSAVFDVAYLNRPCLYYQFDYEEMFSRGHVYGPGYFEYHRDGFGPVVDNLEDLLCELETIADNDFALADEYQERVDRTFKYRDGKCCERVFDAIKELDAPRQNAD